MQNGEFRAQQGPARLNAGILSHRRFEAPGCFQRCIFTVLKAQVRKTQASS